jgi:hypothetical protein
MPLRDAIATTRILGPRLLGAFALGLVLVFIAADGSVVRQNLCESARLCLYSADATYWNKVTYDLALASVASIFFYWLLVRWPDHERRLRLKQSFAVQYRAFKLACIDIFLLLADGSFENGRPEELLDLDAFRTYFKQDLGNRDNRWYRVQNNVNDHYLAALGGRMELLREEISRVLVTTDIADPEILDFFKRLSRATYAFRNASTDYDSVKSLFGFFWSLFSGWDLITGYTGRDFVADMIDRI